MEKIDTTKVLSILSAAESDDLVFDRKIQFICNEILEQGFHSVRYYQAVEDIFSTEERGFILTHCAQRTGNPENIIGLRIPQSETTLLRSGGGQAPWAYGDQESATDSQLNSWAVPLGIAGTKWMDFAVRGQNGALGLFAVSWTGSKELVDDETRSALILVAKKLADLHQSSLAWDRHYSATKQKIEDMVSTENFNFTSSLFDIARLFSEAVPCDLASIFDYNWEYGSITKLVETSPEDCQNFEMMNESYRIGGMLSGKAFSDKKYHFIPNVNSFKKREAHKLSSTSLEYHESKIGELRSICYVVAGTLSNRLMLRFFRASNSKKPQFTTREFELLSSLGVVLGAALDRALLKKQNEVLRIAALDGLTEFADSSRLTETLSGELERTGVKYHLIVNFGKSHGGTDFLRGSNGVRNPFEIFGNDVDSAWFTLKQLPYDTGRNTISAGKLATLGVKTEAFTFEREKISNLLILPVVQPSHTTAVLIPIYDDQASKNYPIQNRLSDAEISHLESLISILGASLEAKYSHISAENADDLLANIGHELNTPVTQIEQAAIATCVTSQIVLEEILAKMEGNDKLKDSIKSHIQDFDRKIDDINKRAELLHHFLDIPRVMSETFGGEKTHVVFTPIKWANIVNDSWDLAFSWANSMSDYYEELGRSSFGTIKMKTNQAVGNMEGIACEPLVKMAVTNLLKNAIKYSIVRYRGSAIEINVTAIPQPGINILRITNWGIGIPSNMMEEIFGKYVRIDRVDAKRAIAGRGLGLYLSRAVIRAQGGSLRCIESTPTLDDSSRTEALEGYLTTFELRLPKTHSVGSEVIQLR